MKSVLIIFVAKLTLIKKEEGILYLDDAEKLALELGVPKSDANQIYDTIELNENKIF